MVRSREFICSMTSTSAVKKWAENDFLVSVEKRLLAEILKGEAHSYPSNPSTNGL